MTGDRLRTPNAVPERASASSVSSAALP